MTYLEDNCLNKLSFKPIFFKRYVDDIITGIPSTDVDSMLHCFNSYHPRLQFTFETELDKTSNFLDIKIIRKSKGLVFDWYIKPTSSGRFIDFNSSHPKCHKVGLICHLVDKAVKLSDKEFHDKNLEIVKRILYNNNFPKKFVLGHIKKRVFNISSKNNNPSESSRNFSPESILCVQIFEEFENLSVEKKTLSTALGFEPRSFDCRSTALTTELHRGPTSNSPQEDLLISLSGSALRL